MQTKVLGYYLCFLAALVLTGAVSETMGRPAPMWVYFVIVGVFLFLQFPVLCCPHCGKCVIIRGTGTRARMTARVGSHCERCRKVY